MATQMQIHFQAGFIAPCGMNCGVCIAHLRKKKPCPGCRTHDPSKPKTRKNCKIKTCEAIQETKSGYCFECEAFPCDRLSHLDKRYRTKYGCSMIDNLKAIRELGMDQFLKHEEEKWRCLRCGGMLCIHEPTCPSCGRKWNR